MTESPQYVTLGERRSASGIGWRLLLALLVFVALAAISMLLPASMPGELSIGQMKQHGKALCRACPPTEQLTAAGMVAGENGWYLNVRFAAPPFNTLLRIAFAGIPGVMELQQTGKTWTNPRAKSAGLPALAGVTERDNLVVFILPATLRTNGFTVSTGSGDHIPEANFIEPVYPSAAHFNGTDIVLLLILAASAWYGHKRGLLPEIGDLIAIIVSLSIAALAYRPLAVWCSQIMPYPRAGAAAGSCLLVLATGMAGFLVLPKLVSRLGTATGPLDPRLNGTLGGAVACLRQLPVIAMLLTAGTDLTVLHWASASINSSILGTALLHAWRTVFSGT